MAGQSPLRRWKPFLAAFGLVDAAIEATGPALCRDEFRSARTDVVERLCGVPARDGGKGEELCRLLDGFMVESLLTLQSVPAYVVLRVLASSSADLTEAVGALRCHQSEPIRRLASDVIRRWSVAVEEDISRMKALQGVRRVKVADEKPPRKKTPPSEEEEKMAATKRKLREGYREVEDAKRQRKIQVIQAPKRLEQQRQRKAYPILRERSQARCARRCSVPSFGDRIKHVYAIGLHRVVPAL